MISTEAEVVAAANAVLDAAATAELLGRHLGRGDSWGRESWGLNNHDVGSRVRELVPHVKKDRKLPRPSS